MSNQYPGGFISKNPPTISNTSSQGIWTMSQYAQYKKAGTWAGFANYVSLLALGGNTTYNGVAVDSQFNTYICSLNSSLLILSKYDYLGNLKWSRQLSNSGQNWSNGIAIDSSDNIYVVGNYDYNILVAKYNSSGSIQWRRSLSRASQNSHGVKVVTDSSNNIYVMGITSRTNSSPANNETVIVKYNSSGVLQWQKWFGSIWNDDNYYNITIDNSGNLYLCGSTFPVGGTGGSPVLGRVAKLDSSGSLVWMKYFTSNSGNGNAANFFDVKISNSGNVYACGYTTFSGDSDQFLVKLDSSGNLVWQTISSGQTYSQVARSIVLDENENIYMYGESGTSSVATIMKVNSSGTQLWTNKLSSAGVNLYSSVGGITLKNNNLYLASGLGGTNTAILASLPVDGTKTGSIIVGSTTLSYGSISLSLSSTTLQFSNDTVNGGGDSDFIDADATSTVTESASSATSTVTLI